MRTVYVNGDYVSEEDAKVSVFDRGFLFADGVYEVTSVLDGKPSGFSRPLCKAAAFSGGIGDEFSDERRGPFGNSSADLWSKTQIQEGLIYLQVTRGVAERDFLFPPEETPRTVVLFTQAKPLIESASAARGQKVATVEDLRWSRCDIKTVQLLYPSMAKMEAQSRGADDAWLVREGEVTEGSSNNAYIVLEDGTIVTRDLSNVILSGITRRAVLKCARTLQMKVMERAFSVEEALMAVEAFTTSASGFVMPVVEIDGQKIGDGMPGPTAKHLREVYIAEMRKAAI